MKKVVVGLSGLGIFGLGLGVSLVAVSATAQRQTLPVSGTVQQVWEDGFLLATGDRTFRVDTWDLCGDRTVQALVPGEQVSLTGERDGREWDAFSVTKADGSQLCQGVSPPTTSPMTSPAEPSTASASGTPVLGKVQQVWEDGFLLADSDRQITVDTWELCGDRTAQYLSTGHDVVVTGEFDEGEFDAFSLTKPDGTPICP